ncbi:RNA polymerase sigma factor [Spirillospora sp. CA-255316]
MHGDLETLYDAHAHRLYAHCWSLLGDRDAADALRDTLTEAVRYPPRGETVPWLHRMTRTVCSERGAFGRHGRPVFAQATTDPLLNAAANLPAGHREALLLSAGEWLEVRDIAAVLRVSPGTVHELLHEARTALERAVLDALMRGIADPAKHMDVIAAFEKGRLPNLLARRAPAWAPAPLRDQVLAASDGHERDEIGHAPAEPAVAAAPTRQLVVIGSDAETSADPERERANRRKAALKGVGGVAGVAASVAAGLVMTWPSAGDGTVNALGPSDGNTRPGPVPVGSVTDEPGAPQRPSGGQKDTAPTPTTTTEGRAPVAEEPTGSGGGATGLAKPPKSDTPSVPSPASPPDSQRQTSAPPQQSPEPQPDDEPRQDGPLKPVTDIVGSITSPILGGLTGQQQSGG